MTEQLLALEHDGWRSPCQGTVDSFSRDVINDDALTLLAYTGMSWRDGQEKPFVGAVSSVHHRTAGGWKLALHQQTIRQ